MKLLGVFVACSMFISAWAGDEFRSNSDWAARTKNLSRSSEIRSTLIYLDARIQDLDHQAIREYLDKNQNPEIENYILTEVQSKWPDNMWKSLFFRSSCGNVMAKLFQ